MTPSNEHFNSTAIGTYRGVEGLVPAGLKTLPLFEVWCIAPRLESVIDPFNFLHRVAVYRRLLEATNSGERFGADNAGNPLWGLLFQLHWQHQTHRLDPLNTSLNGISEDSPWGFGNFSLSIIPLLGAIRAGTLGDFSIVKPSEATQFDYAYGASEEVRYIPKKFQPGVAAWCDFFLAVQISKRGDDDEHLRMSLWRAHKICLDVIAERIADIETTVIPREELSFLRGWCRMVDYLWAAAWPTDFHFMVERGLDALPGKILEPSDLPTATSELPEPIQKTVISIIILAKTSKIRHALNLWLWRRVMRHRSARVDVVSLLDAVFNPDVDNAKDRRRLLRYLF